MEYLIVSLLAIVALVEAYRFYQTVRPYSKKGHFRGKLQGTRTLIYDLEFKRFKTREIREDVRKEYDMDCSRIHALEKQLEALSSDDEKKTIEDKKVLAERDRDRHLAQMRRLDAEVNGQKPTNDDPDGVIGITEQISSYKELAKMLEDYIKTL